MGECFGLRPKQRVWVPDPLETEPGSHVRVGILGTGQLARMMALAGHRLGIPTVVVGPAGCARDVTEHREADLHDPDACARAVSDVDVVTYELEQLPLGTVERLAAVGPVYPPPKALAVSQDRWLEKRFLNDRGVATAPFARVDGPDDLRRASDELGFPMLLKSRCEGYDGKGQRWYSRKNELPPVSDGSLSGCIVEGRVAFERELSLVAVRTRQGKIASYPLVENDHRDQILAVTRAPAPVTAAQARDAQSIAERVLEALDYVGVLAIEFFEVNGSLVVNELAPRVHNSGHWTIEGAQTSQFENHLRAVLGLPTGSTDARGHVAMVNLIGEAPPLASLLSIPGVAVHLYGKSARPGRKLGHVTVVSSTPDDLSQVVATIEGAV